MRSKKIRHYFSLVFVVIFWLFALFQIAFGYREDFPFTYFGMYKESNVGKMFKISITVNGRQKKISLYSCLGQARLALNKRIRKYWKKEVQKNPRLKQSDIVPDQKYVFDIVKSYIQYIDLINGCTFEKEDKLVVLMQYWKDLTPDKYNTPDDETVLLSTTMGELIDQGSAL